jgi:hypothetical protein
MKKITIALFVMIASASFNPGSANAQVLQKGNIVVDAYYGFPNLWTTVLKAAYLPGYETTSKWGSMGPIGVKGEYLISDKMGVGLDINYSNSWVSWTEENSIYNSSTGLYSDGNYKVLVPRIAIMPRFYYHFLNKDKFEMYGSAALGYKSTSFKYTSNDPTWNETDMSVVPIGERIAVGGRFFFTDNIGINFEFGIGGALLTAGLAVKL